MKAELIVALDVASSRSIREIVRQLPPRIQWYKIGLELFSSEGPEALEPLKAQNKRIFLDLKLHDIPRTVARAVTAVARHGVSMLTVHTSGGPDMLKAAADAAKELGEEAPKLVAVTVLTSLNDADLKALGVSRTTNDQALALGKMAISSGIDGLVCSVHEAAALRENLGADPILVTPGIRLHVSEDAPTRQVRQSGRQTDDQKRIATPAAAVSGGADYLVVGRPILQAPDPHEAAMQILRQINAASPSA